ncbi:MULTISPECIES: hypothetical protein [Spirulina sp. CCY15215]|nr:hypothetical protein [Spirulina major]
MLALLEDETILNSLLRQAITIELIAAFQNVVNSLESDRLSE